MSGIRRSGGLQPSIKEVEENPPGVGYSALGALHKAIIVRYYIANRSHHLVIKKKDAAWLGLEPGEDLTINFRKRREQ